MADRVPLKLTDIGGGVGEIREFASTDTIPVLHLPPTSWTTAGRPSSPYAGLRGFNTTLACNETWNGADWEQEGWQYGSSVAASGASFNVITTIPAWANEVALNLVDLSPDDANRFVLRLNGQTTGYKGSGGVAANPNIVLAEQDTTGFRFVVANTVNALNGLVTLRRLGGNIWGCSAALGNSGSTSTFVTGGTISLPSALTTASFAKLVSGNFDAGTVYPSWRK